MRTGFDRPFSVVLNFSAPENGLPFFIGGLQFQPDVEGVHGAARKKVADFAGSNHDIDKIIIAAAHGSLHASKRRGDFAGFAAYAFWSGRFGLFANRESGGKFRPASERRGRGGFGGLVSTRNRKHVDGDLLVLQKLYTLRELHRVFVGGGNGGVGAREAVRVHKAVDAAFVLGGQQRHVAVGAHHGIRRIIKRARALTGNAAGLPVVILVEAAHPAIFINRNIEVNFVASGTELGSLFAHERFQEGAAVRLGIHLNHKVVQRAHHRIFAGRQFVQLRIFQDEIALAHGAFHFHDAVTHHAGKAGLGGRSVFNLADGRIKNSAEQ